MKHNSEDISRLDGDIYQTLSGQLFDMSQVVSVGNLEWKNTYPWGYYYDVICRMVENPVRVFMRSPKKLSHGDIVDIVTRKNPESEEDYYSEYKKTEQTDRKKISDHRESCVDNHKDFINIWKEWKKNEARK